MSGEPLKREGEKLIKYFLASLAIPDRDLWVNLSPYEKTRMVPEALGQTDMGRDLLEQDYILKQITASLIYPEKKLGQTFWNRVYAKAHEMYGTTQVPINTFNKVWIMADKAEVFEHNQTAFVVGCHLKVMLEEDYLALQKHLGANASTSGVIASPSSSVIASPSSSVIASEAKQSFSAQTGIHSLGSQIIRQIILPELEKEVNTGRNFANLRQIFNSIILSSWYKKSLKQALLNQVYANKSKINGINLNDPTIKQQIYEQYLKAYKKGVFNFIKEDVNNAGKTMPRKYFSGGEVPGAALTPNVITNLVDGAMALERSDSGDSFVDFATLAETASSKNHEVANAAMTSEPRKSAFAMSPSGDRLINGEAFLNTVGRMANAASGLLGLKQKTAINVIPAQIRISGRPEVYSSGQLMLVIRDIERRINGFLFSEDRSENLFLDNYVYDSEYYFLIPEHDYRNLFNELMSSSPEELGVKRKSGIFPRDRLLDLKLWLDSLKRQILNPSDYMFHIKGSNFILNTMPVQFKQGLWQKSFSPKYVQEVIDEILYDISDRQANPYTNVPKGSFAIQNFWEKRPYPFYVALAKIMEQKGWRGKLEKLQSGRYKNEYQLSIGREYVDSLVKWLNKFKDYVQTPHMGPSSFDADTAMAASIENMVAALHGAYEHGETDEFVKPIVLVDGDNMGLKFT